MKKDSRAPLIVAIVLLLLPVLYVGSYFALVVPPGKSGLIGRYGQYRVGGLLAEFFFYPLEQIDHKVRPKTWIAPRKE
jgi:hypothetical protein